MKSFTVHEPPTPAADPVEHASELSFVRDGFNFFAFLLAPIWMLLNGLWLVLFGYLVLQAAVQLAFEALNAGPVLKAAIGLWINLVVGFEADSLKRWTLQRRGWRLLGSVTGENRDVCERRFMEAWLPTVTGGVQPAVRPDNGLTSSTGNAAVAFGAEGAQGGSGTDAAAPEQPAPPQPPRSWARISPWRRSS